VSHAGGEQYGQQGRAGASAADGGTCGSAGWRLMKASGKFGRGVTAGAVGLKGASPGLSARPAARPAAWARPRVVKEFLLVGVFCLIYEELREHMVQAGAVAASHALSIVNLERDLGLFHEQAAQTALLKVPGLVHVFNLYYGGTHFLIPAAVLIWLALRHPERYARSRTTLAAATGLAFACFWLFPVAPPRMLPSRFGIADTLVALGSSGHLETTLINTAGDKYASMPSLHVAWAVWCALALYPVISHRTLRLLAAVYPVLTTLVVVTTGNHFFLDAIAGALLVSATWIVISRISNWWADKVFMRALPAKALSTPATSTRTQQPQADSRQPPTVAPARRRASYSAAAATCCLSRSDRAGSDG
jgi:hypothetical protein